MAHLLRIPDPGASYRITSRRNAEAAIFLKDEVCERFVAVQGDVFEDSR
jgi:hypothetical protein